VITLIRYAGPDRPVRRRRLALHRRDASPGSGRHQVVGTEVDAADYPLPVADSADQMPSPLPCPHCPVGVNVVRGLARVIHKQPLCRAGTQRDARVLSPHTDRG
jgi:hypothetical protein